MSYIRATSNPEGLYIFGGYGQPVEINTGRGWDLSNIGPDQGTIVLPEDVFFRAVQAWRECYGHEVVEVRGFRIEELHIYTKNSKFGKAEQVIPDDGTWDIGQALNDDPNATMFAVKLSYKKLYTFLWRVTWAYVVANATGDEADEERRALAKEAAREKPRKKSETRKTRKTRKKVVARGK